jgi:glycine reductase
VAKEIERVGIPVVVCSAIPTIPVSVGVSRIVHGKAVPHLLGDPSLPAEWEFALRERLTAKALASLTTEVVGPTLFSLD